MDSKFSITSATPRIPYTQRVGYYDNVIHWGQRKLCLVEIRLLELAAKMGITQGLIVYVGAAVGTHILYLIDRYPGFEWHLYDSNRFDTKLNHSRVTIFQEYFTQETKSRYAKVPVAIYISDLRVIPDLNTDSLAREAREKDLALQLEIHHILQPKLTSIKFALPYPGFDAEGRPWKDEYIYADGEIWAQPFAPQNSTETRLIIRGTYEKKVYSCLEFEQQLAYINAERRKNKPDSFFVFDNWDAEYEKALLSHEESIKLNKVLGVDFRKVFDSRRKAYHVRTQETAGVKPNTPEFIINRILRDGYRIMKIGNPSRMPQEVSGDTVRDRFIRDIRSCCLGLSVKPQPALKALFPNYRIGGELPKEANFKVETQYLDIMTKLVGSRPAECDVLLLYIELWIQPEGMTPKNDPVFFGRLVSGITEFINGGFYQ